MAFEPENTKAGLSGAIGSDNEVRGNAGGTAKDKAQNADGTAEDKAQNAGGTAKDKTQNASEAAQGKAGDRDDLNRLLKVRRDKLNDLQKAGKDPFVITKYNQTHHSLEIKDNFEELEGKTVSIAGRMMLKRVMGKASFCHIQDRDGQIQAYVARDAVGEEAYADFKKFDIGDIVGIEGYVFKTKAGEVTVHAAKIVLLSKSLQILPEKYHGITNVDMRYRQRYVDLIMNPEVKDTFRKRSLILKEIRNFLDGRDFIEVETPMLVSNAGGAAARPFETHSNALNEDFKLRISLELYLKRLIVGGLERVYEIGRVFRNEGIDTRHNPEFTLMELYQAYTDYEGMMELTESMFRYLANKVCGGAVINYRGTVIDMGKPFARMSMSEAVLKYSGVDFDQILTLDEARAAARDKNVEFEEKHSRGDILNLFFEQFCEENLIQPTFITDHPIEISPLTKKNPRKPGHVERFELFIYGREMCNAYSELNDPIDQRERFKIQDAMAAAGDEEANHTDEDFLNALEIGMPPTGGIGYGIDRLVMLLTDAEAIRDVLLFPTLKSVADKNDAGSRAASAGSSGSVSCPPGVSAAAVSSISGSANPAGLASASVPSGEGEAISASALSSGAAGNMPAALPTPKLPEEIDFSKIVIEPLFEETVDFDTFSKSDFRVVKVKHCEAVPKSKKLLKFILDDGSGNDRVILSGISHYYEPEELIGRTCVAITNLPPRKMMGIDSCGMLISAVCNCGDEEMLNLLMLDDRIPAGAKLY